MRTQLAARDECRGQFQGTFVRLGTKRGWEGHQEQTVLLQDIRDAQGKVVADHVWLNLTKGLAALNLQTGETVLFEARVKQYLKGYQGHREDVWKPVEVDYKLSHPTKVRRLTPEDQEDHGPLFAAQKVLL